MNFTPISDACFSECGKYRHWLMRQWGPPESGIMGCFVGKNPSVAGRENNDATMHREIAFAKSWGWRGLLKVNLFDWIATDSDELINLGSKAVSEDGLVVDVIGYIKRFDCRQVVCVWGTHSNRGLRQLIQERGQLMERKLKEAGLPPYALVINRGDGTPKHTLYLNPTLKPELIEILRKRVQ